MKITLLTRRLVYGGGEYQLSILAKALAAQKHQIKLIVLYAGGALEKSITTSSINVHCLNKKHRWDILLPLYNLTTILRKNPPDILYSYLPSANLVTILLKLFLPKCKIVWGIRSSHVDNNCFSKCLFFLLRVFSKLPDLIIANSYTGSAFHQAKGFPSNKLTVIPNGINTVDFIPISTQKNSTTNILNHDGNIVVGLVSRLDPIKDHPSFIQAASIICNTRTDVRFVCIGCGADKYTAQLKQLCGTLNLTDHFAWLGYVPSSSSTYATIDILVSTSISEGFSNTIAEAMACGIPCVVTDTGDSKFIVGDTGLVVPTQSPEILANAILSYVDLEKQERMTIGAKARQRIVDNFSISQLVKNTENALSAVISENHTPKPLI